MDVERAARHVAGARAADAPPLQSLDAAASSLGKKALTDPAAFELVESLTTDIGQRLAGTNSDDSEPGTEGAA